MISTGCGQATAEWMIGRLEEAGRTMLALPASGHGLQIRTSRLEWVRESAEIASARNRKMKPGAPPPDAISRMDEAYRWVSMIPNDRYVLRRVIGARSLIDPLTDRHLYTWRRLGRALGADHKAVQRWHCQGIDLLVSILNSNGSMAA